MSGLGQKSPRNLKTKQGTLTGNTRLLLP